MAATTGDPQEQYLGRVKATEQHDYILAGQAGTLRSVDPTTKMATVEFDWLVLPSTMAGQMAPQPNIQAQIPTNMLAAIDSERVPV